MKTDTMTEEQKKFHNYLIAAFAIYKLVHPSISIEDAELVVKFLADDMKEFMHIHTNTSQESSLVE